MAKASKADALIREREAVALRQQGKTFIEIAQALGYAGTPESAAGTAHGTVMRALRRDISEDAKQVRLEDLSRLEALLTSIWAFATNDVVLALQYYTDYDEDGNKVKLPDTCKVTPKPGDRTHVHASDDSGAHICYVMPTDVMLKSQERALKVLERRSRYLGLDHADGVADRIADIMKQNAVTLGEYVKGILDQLNLNDDQREMAKIIIMKDFQKEAS